ncbi:MAG: metal-sensitive transcriptional regulator [Candidatus Moranbacteria bacterium]|nr:metal-sensitive transcriptional regulator [Candidatus Moranbacteria bacterium]
MEKKRVVKNKIATKKVAHEKVIKRIARIEGQIGGIKRMVESERECLDIIQQISAIRQAVAMLGIELLKDEFLCKRKAHKEIDEKFLQTLFKAS